MCEACARQRPDGIGNAVFWSGCRTPCPGRDAGCGIYDRRPAQCRALSCSDTRGIAELYGHDRASRADVMRAVGAP